MKKIGNFQTEDKDRLSEQLDRFQEAVDQETSDIRAQFMPMLAPRLFSPSTPIGTTLTPGQLALCDSASGNVSVVLSLGKPGWCAVVKRSAANTVNVFPSGSSGFGARRINATTSVAYGAGVVGVNWIYFDGLDWWA